MSNIKATGVDVAKWNPIQSYESMKADGINFAIPKAINKSLKKDGLFETHMKGFEKAEINIIGTYHYTYATDTAKAKQSAKAWVDAVDERCNVFFLDWEDASLPTKNATTMKNIINAYADVIQNAGGTMAIYTGMSLHDNYMKKLNLPYDMWIARYYLAYQEFTLRNKPNEQYCPASSRLLGWQYTSTGKVSGCSGRLDLDVWYKDTVKNAVTITATFNPFTMPTGNIKLGTTGDAARWLEWCLWRFGFLVDMKGKPDETLIDGEIGTNDVAMLKKAQSIFGLKADGIAGAKTKPILAKYC